MSKMADLALTVEELLEEGLNNSTIADKLKIPEDWVEGIREILIEYNNDN